MVVATQLLDRHLYAPPKVSEDNQGTIAGAKTLSRDSDVNMLTQNVISSDQP